MPDLFCRACERVEETPIHHKTESSQCEEASFTIFDWARLELRLLPFKVVEHFFAQLFISSCPGPGLDFRPRRVLFFVLLWDFQYRRISFPLANINNPP